MTKVAQVAFSGLSGASDVCAALALAGRKAGVLQTIAFWGTEPVIEARRKRCADAGIESAAFPKKRGLDFAGQRAVQQWAAKNRDADAFILHYPAAIFAVRKALRGMARPPLVIAIEHHPNSLKRPHEWLLSALLLWRADGVVYLTDGYRDAVARRLGPLFSLRKKRTTVIGNGIELDRYQMPGLAKTPGEFVIGMSGRMTPVKDYVTLLRAFATLRDDTEDRALASASAADGAAASTVSSPGSALSGPSRRMAEHPPHPGPRLRIELAGDGPMRPDLEALAASLSITHAVTFLGLVPFDDLLPRMRSWDAFVLSTHGETQPLALMEAMACGLPCIGSAVAGVTDVIRDGQNGILVPESDPVALASALAHLASDPARRACLADAALYSAKASFSSAKMWENFRNFIGSLGR